MAILFKRTDKLLPFATIILSIISILLLYSVSAMKFQYIRSDSYLIQSVAFGVGILAAFIIALFDYRKFSKLWFIYLPISIVFVVLTYTSMGVTVNGQRAWLNFKNIITFQPSEVLKIAFILSFGYHLSLLGKKNMNKFSNFLVLCLHALVPIALVVAQKDDGTALVFIFITAMMLIFAGLSWKYILSAVVVLPAVAMLLWVKVLTDYQKQRFLIIFDLNKDPDGLGYQQLGAQKMIFSSGIFGKGLFKHNYDYLAEMDNDFIFSFAAQAMGFIGCAIIVFLYIFILTRILTNGFRSKNALGKNICVGVFSMFLFHIVLNIAMNFGYAPVIGIPLPFLSSGGTYLITSYVALGIVMSVYSHTGKAYKKSKR